MPFIGNQPAEKYSSFQKQDFTTSATTSYTLDHPVANANELALFINFVRQEPTTAYTASGTSLTLTSATSASDDMYCVFLGKAVQTVNPPSGSVGTSQIADLAVTSGKLASGVLPTNTPAFLVKLSSDYNIANASSTKIQYTTEVFDTANAFDNSTNYRFTVPSGQAGKYYCYFQVRANGWGANRFVSWINVNGSVDTVNAEAITAGASYPTIQGGVVLDLDVGDFIEHYVYHNQGGTQAIQGSSTEHKNLTFFGGYKLIT